MNKKKGPFVVVIGFLAFLCFIMPFVSAYYGGYGGGYGFLDLRQGSEQVIQWTVDFGEPFLRVLLGGNDWSGYLLFEKFLLFILLASIVFLAIKNISLFENNRGVTWVVTLIVPLLGVRYLDFEWVNTIILQYQVLGIALTGIFPFIIYLFFLHNISESNTVRKIGWIFFIVVYFGLWSTTQNDNYGEIYFWTMIISFVFLLLDGTIHRYFMMEKFKQGERMNLDLYLARIDERIRLIENSNLNDKRKKKDLEKLEKEKLNAIKAFSN